LLPSSKEGDYFNLWSSPVRLADIRENQLTLASVVATVFSVHHRVKATNSACVGPMSTKKSTTADVFNAKIQTDLCHYYFAVADGHDAPHHVVLILA